jgi:hypothetical protein
MHRSLHGGILGWHNAFPVCNELYGLCLGMEHCMHVRSFDEAATYRITVLGYLDPGWSDRLGAMTITPMTDPGSRTVTTLLGRLLDQAALAGVLNTLYDLGLTLLFVERFPDCVSSNTGPV